MKKVIILKGLPASGKSTWAKQQLDAQPGAYKRINKDDLRAMLDNSHWSKSNEKFVLRLRDQLILAALEDGKHVIIDDTNLHPKHEQQIRQLVKGQAEVEVRMFDADVEECVERDAGRAKPFGAKVIRDMHRQFIAPAARPYAPPAGLLDAVLCDLDGTLALLNGRNPYDAATCENDTLNPVVAGILRAMGEGVRLVLVSGREEHHRPKTERWLARHGIAYDVLHMRATGDNRRDAIIKEEIFDAHIRPHYAVRFVLDDRNQVVAMWRRLGLVCLQVADGDF